jgi:tight adherence protein B
MATQILSIVLVVILLLGVTLFWVRRVDRRRQFVQQRLRSLTIGKDNDKPTPRLALRMRQASSTAVFQVPHKIAAWLDAAFEATGMRIKLMHLIIAGIIAVIIVVAFTSRILALSPGLVMAFGVLAAVGAPLGLLLMAQARYQRKFLDVFPDALDLVGRGVKAGLPVNEALAVAGREIADPVGAELRRALDQVQIGVQMGDALQTVADRVRVADFRFMVVALALQSKTGGSLAETLANLSGIIRARKALRLKARALSAEARASAMVLAGLPFVIGGAMYVMNQDLMRSLFVDSRGRFMVGLAFLSLVTGLITMSVLVRRAVR